MLSKYYYLTGVELDCKTLCKKNTQKNTMVRSVLVLYFQWYLQRVYTDEEKESPWLPFQSQAYVAKITPLKFQSQADSLCRESPASPDSLSKGNLAWLKWVRQCLTPWSKENQACFSHANSKVDLTGHCRNRDNLQESRVGCCKHEHVDNMGNPCFIMKNQFYVLPTSVVKWSRVRLEVCNAIIH